MTSNKYTIEFFWSDEDGGFMAVVADLPGCSAFGNTIAEAAAEIEDAIAAWIAAAIKAGNAIPEPNIRSDIHEYSGRILLRMPKELHRDLQIQAKSQAVSLNSYVCYLLSMKHYHTHAIREFASSLQWRAFGYKSAGGTQQVIQLASVTNEPKQFSASTARQSEPILAPIAAIGVS